MATFIVTEASIIDGSHPYHVIEADEYTQSMDCSSYVFYRDTVAVFEIRANTTSSIRLVEQREKTSETCCERNEGNFGCCRG